MSLRLLSIAVSAVLISPASLAGAEVNRSWQELVQAVKEGKTVVVTRMNSAKVEGKLLGINAESITVERESQPQVVQREDVFRVRYANIRMKHTAWGMLIGAAGGAVILGAMTRDSIASSTGGAAFGAILGLGIGAAVGGSLPIGAPLYEAEKPVPVKKGP